MATLYTHQDSNVTKTWFLMGLFLALIAAIGYFASVVYGNPGIFYIAIVFSLLMNIVSYWYSDKIVLGMTGAKEADPVKNRELIRIVENLAITAGLPMPRVYIVEDMAPNAFATGRNKEHAVVAVTTGLLSILDKNELEGVVAHELAHIGNRDILLSTVVVVLVGFVSIMADIFLRSSFSGNRDNKHGGILVVIGIVFIILSPIFAQLIQLAISRKREFLADATGALLTRYPEGLASALEKIHTHARPMAKASNATAHLFISNPFEDSEHGKKSIMSKIGGLFMTHPPVGQRVGALRGMEM